MKTFITLFAAATGLASTATACIQVHAYWSGDVVGQDVLSIQASDNGVQVCNGASTQSLSNEDTEFCIDSSSGCNDGYEICLTKYGLEGWVSNNNENYVKAPLFHADTHEGEHDGICGGTVHEECQTIKERETCLDDNYWNCNNYPYCALCDFKATCS